jgi:hypothetical protein
MQQKINLGSLQLKLSEQYNIVSQQQRKHEKKLKQNIILQLNDQLNWRFRMIGKYWIMTV